MTHRFRLASSSILALLVAGALVAPPAGADTTTQAAVDWVVQRQEADGGFEVADFPAFETPDAILAIAENAQTGATWDTQTAFDAVQSHDGNGGEPGGTPLDWVDDYLAETPPDAGIAAKFIVLIAGPLGLDPAAFDPAGDGDPIDLVAVMDAGEDPESHSYGDGFLNYTLFALLAHPILERPAPADTLGYLRGAQQASGGWSYDGASSGTDVDVDSTARAINALLANGVPLGDATVAKGMKYLADQHQASGAWQFFGADDTNTTAMGLIGITAAGWRPGTSCWRTSSSSAASGAYVNPAAWLRTQQVTTGDAEDLGRFLSPNDGFGPEPNTSATTQAVQALLRGWQPVAPADAPRTQGFADVPACAWYTQGVAWMAANGVTRNTTGNFGPKSGITNGQLALLLWNTMDAPSGLPDHTFTDIPTNAAYNDAVDWMVDTGLVPDGGTFSPKRQVNRGRVANLLWQLAGSPVAPDLTIPDVSETAPFADAVDWAVAHGIITPQANGNVLPRNKVTRAQAAVMLHRLASTSPAWGDVTLPSTVEF